MNDKSDNGKRPQLFEKAISPTKSLFAAVIQRFSKQLVFHAKFSPNFSAQDGSLDSHLSLRGRFLTVDLSDNLSDNTRNDKNLIIPRY
jgi:formamidopyrimidine-DNA glycosylase